MSLDSNPAPSQILEKRITTQIEREYLKAIEASNTDRMTGLYNRDYWERERPRLEKSGHLAYIIIVSDLDGLKKINDSQGHEAGGQMIIDGANIIRTAFRPEDVSIRYGGDEIVTILATDTSRLNDTYEEFKQENNLPDISMDKYLEQIISSRLTHNISNFNQTHPDSPVSISFGIKSSLPTTGAPPHHNLIETFNAADEKMYQMKEIHHQTAKVN